MVDFTPGDYVVPNSEYWKESITAWWSKRPYYRVFENHKVYDDQGYQWDANTGSRFFLAPPESCWGEQADAGLDTLDDLLRDEGDDTVTSEEFEYCIEIAFVDGTTYELGVCEDFSEDDLEDILYDLTSGKPFVRIETFIVRPEDVKHISWVR